MELKGKKVVFLGDSITEGVGATDIENRYANVFQRLTDCEVFVDGISGTRIAKQKTLDENEGADLDFVSRVDGLPSDADFVVVFGGTNDFGHGDAPFGTFEDKTEYTFCGALHVLCRKLLQKYPLATIIFMTPLHRLTEDSEINEKGLPRKKLFAYVDMIRRVCEYYSLPVLDLYKLSGMQPAVQEIREKYMPDGLHPSDAGAAKMAALLKQFIFNL